MQLRPAKADERLAIAQLWRRAWSSANPHVDTLAPIEHWLGRLDAEFGPPCDLLAVDHGDELAGFMVLDRARGYLAQCFVDPRFQSQGLGRAMLDAVCALMPEGWTLHVAAINTGARRFYERYGLAEGAWGTHPVSGRACIEYRWGAVR